LQVTGAQVAGDDVPDLVVRDRCGGTGRGSRSGRRGRGRSLHAAGPEVELRRKGLALLVADAEGKALDVDQVHRRDVVRGDAAAPGAAPERHRWSQARGRTDRAVARQRVAQDPERGLLESELLNDVRIARVDDEGVADTPEVQELLADLA